jgi:hypothetical protein
MSIKTSCRIRCRRIEETDIGCLSHFLERGFPSHSESHWRTALERLKCYDSPSPFPKFGYMLEAGRCIVGVLLTIFSTARNIDQVAFLCNTSCWYVDPAFSSYATLLSVHAEKKYPNVTYINASPAAHTFPLIEAQGFQRLTDGLYTAATALTVPLRAPAAFAFGDGRARIEDLTGDDYKLLTDHHSYGCLCLWCESSDGYHPFIFRKRFVAKGSVPTAHLIYCRSLEDLSRFSGVVSRFLLLRGIPFLIVNANGPIPNFAGRYFPNRRPMYYRGCCKPRIGDLTYTERAMFGV